MVANAVIIPLRSGSKGIPGKNIKCFNGYPLAYWVVKECLKATSVDRIIIATDSEIIWGCLKKYFDDERLRVFWRSSASSTDEAATETVIEEYLRAHGASHENIILVQATSPLLRVEDILDGIRKINSKEYDSVLSVVRERRFIWGKSSDKKNFLPMNYDLLSRPRRQEHSGFLVENGALYITKVEDFLKTNCRLNGRIGVVEMSPDSYYEIDEEADWIVVESLHRRQMEVKFSDSLKNIKLIAFDVDGVLTDSGMYYSNQGDELKKFNTRDGKAVEMLRNAGIKVAIITSENTALVQRRAQKLNVDEVFQGTKDKLSAMRAIADKYSLDMSEIAYIGDDINDTEVLSAVGFSACPRDAVDKNLRIVDYVSTRRGGEGVVRDVADLVLRSIRN